MTYRYTVLERMHKWFQWCIPCKSLVDEVDLGDDLYAEDLEDDPGITESSFMD